MITFDVEPDDGDKFEVKADSRDVLVWEKTSRSNEKFMELLSTLSMPGMYRLAHIASKRQGHFEGSLAEFEKTCVLHFNEDKVVPTSGEA